MKVSNPLTIIAIFSGLAETLATVALVQLPAEMQSIFIYFVMAFPTIIVLLFFLILYNKNTVLYAPSDYENQNHYLEVNQIKESINSEIESIFTELNKNGARLSKEEIDKAKSSLEITIEDAANSSVAENILDYLKDGPASLGQIAKSHGMSKSRTFSVLQRMTNKKLITKELSDNIRNNKWKLNT